MTMQPKDLIDDITEVVSLPAVYNRIDGALNDPASTIADISVVVSEDPGTTSRLLRLANSAFYGVPRGVETVSQAVSVLGTQQVKDLALATSVTGLFHGVPQQLVSMADFWTHSVATAMIARLLGRARRQANVERLFVAGMLHDIGRLIMLKKLPAEMKRVFESSASKPCLLYKAEREVLGFDHASVGRALLDAWLIPESLAEVVEFHHNPAGARKYPLETAIVHVADIIAHAMDFGGAKRHFVPPLMSSAWRELDIPMSDLPAIMEQVQGEVAQVVSTLLRQGGGEG